MRGGGAEEPAGPVHGGREQLLEGVGTRDRLGEGRQRLELAHAAARLLVEARVLDRPRDERARRDDEVDIGLRELVRSLRVRGDDSDHAAVAGLHRNAEERLVAVLLQLGHVLDARIGEQVLAHVGGLAMLRRPPGEALAALEPDAAGEVAERVGGRPEDERALPLVHEVDEARVDGAAPR